MSRKSYVHPALLEAVKETARSARRDGTAARPRAPVEREVGLLDFLASGGKQEEPSRARPPERPRLDRLPPSGNEARMQIVGNAAKAITNGREGVEVVVDWFVINRAELPIGSRSPRGSSSSCSAFAGSGPGWSAPTQIAATGAA